MGSVCVYSIEEGLAKEILKLAEDRTGRCSSEIYTSSHKD